MAQACAMDSQPNRQTALCHVWSCAGMFGLNTSRRLSRVSAARHVRRVDA